ncbi:MAG TPA: hypothetical protein DCR40_14255 [Prolixibacteraceae bacterium]|nr:hypothetical protein [Prolixibacteraceae bacterium]
MKKNILFLILTYFVLGFSNCELSAQVTTSNNTGNPKNWTDKQVSTWFNQKEWLGKTELRVGPFLNKKEFAIQYFKHKDWWDKAFDFLKLEDLSAISVGVHELDSQNVFVKVTEYYTKNPEKILFEAHRNYSDIQYVISGAENIQMAKSESATLKVSYNTAKDIEFYQAKVNQNLLAKPGTCFIIFPNELHRPSIMVADSVWVKKIVIKVRN